MHTAPEHVAAPLLAGLNPLDWAIVVVLAFSAVTAFLRGLIRSVVSLVGVAAGLVMAAWYAPAAAVYVAPWVTPAALAQIVGFAAVFAAVFLLASLLGRALRNASHAVGLGFVDRLGGAAFGVVRATLVLAVLMVPLSPFLPLIPYTRNSVLLPYLRTAAHGVSFVVPQHFGDRLTEGARQLRPASPASGHNQGQRQRFGSALTGAATTPQNEGDRP